ncbi:hypothetical protein [Konateibacter massiliensis]|uniref:hypothetical protein n=1 Tax=Konateibacter massiliensis TaxID=2002841 RepID=UPI000C146E98|nr:hypothetical protein [Konateibacter massiliensis]
MIDVKYKRDESSKNEIERVIINGIYDKESYHSKFLNNSVSIYNQEIINILLAEKTKELVKYFGQLSIPMDVKYYPTSISEHDWSDIILVKESDGIKLQFSFQYDTDEWKNTYSLNDFGEHMELFCNDDILIEYEQEDEEMIGNGFRLFKTIESIDNTYGDVIDKFSFEVNVLFEKVIDSLVKIHLQNSINFEFSVSNDIKIACEQYLTYFIQFLEDLGVQANSKISSESQKILFSVLPNDPDIALENIKEALDVYLQLPMYIDESNTLNKNDVAVLQLQSNISHLNSQLALAKATMIAQEKTIAALELISTEKIKNAENKNEEKILNGLLTITEYEKKCIKINIPEILRTLKRKFK